MARNSTVDVASIAFFRIAFGAILLWEVLHISIRAGSS